MHDEPASPDATNHPVSLSSSQNTTTPDPIKSLPELRSTPTDRSHNTVNTNGHQVGSPISNDPFRTYAIGMILRGGFGITYRTGSVTLPTLELGRRQLQPEQTTPTLTITMSLFDTFDVPLGH